MGRRKIEMTMVADSNCRQVTFSKRRTGLFKKANELATLCGAEIAVVVFSPGGKPFSFGQPTVESVADRVISRETTTRSRRIVRRTRTRTRTSTAISARSHAATLTEQLNEIMNDLEEEKEIGEAIDDEIRDAKARIGDVDELGLRALEKSLMELRDVAGEKVAEAEASSTLLMLSGDLGSD